MDLDTARADDATDPLATLRRRFALDPDIVYLDGNSLGPPQHAGIARVKGVLDEWRDDLIASWWDNDWLEAPRLVAERIARFVGARPGEVAVADSTSTNLAKVLGAALTSQRGRRTILVVDDVFPTDRYVAKGVAGLNGWAEVRFLAEDRLADQVGDDTAVVLVDHVQFTTGRRRNVARLAEATRRAGALLAVDLSHSVGAIEVDLGGWDVDLAVGCTYKYLSGGPGSPAFVFANDRVVAGLRSPIAGWFGHAEPFAFTDDYVPAPGAGRFRNGTPPMLSMAALEAATRLLDDVQPQDVWRKSAALTGRFVALVAEHLPELELLSPADASRRGAQVSLRHPEAERLVAAFADAGVIGDHRPPDVLRFGFSPWFVRHVDVPVAVSRMRDVLDAR